MIDVKSFMAQKRQDMINLEKLLTSVIAMAPENGGDGETEKCNVLENWLKDRGFKNIQRIEAPDSRVSSGKRPNLIVTIEGKNKDYAVWSMAHMDVVPTGDLALWNTNPWEAIEKDGKIYGRGVEDNQQGLISQIFAALYYVENNIIPSQTIKLLFAADEECGSEYGIIYLLKNHEALFTKNDIIVIPDGGDPNGETIEIAEKNLLWIKFHVTGKQTHGSRPDSGNNACLAAADLTMRINNFEKIFNKRDSLFEPDYSTFQPTMRLKNVDGVNMIPGEDTFYFDCRILPCYSLNEVISKMNEEITAVENLYGVKIDYSFPQKAESPATPINAPVVEKLKQAILKTHGINARCIGIGGGTVGAELRREGYHAAVWSTLDDMAHQPNEYCSIDNLIKDALTLVSFFE